MPGKKKKKKDVCVQDKQSERGAAEKRQKKKIWWKSWCVPGMLPWGSSKLYLNSKGVEKMRDRALPAH